MIYLDNAANTFICYAAQKVMLKEISSVGNPSSIHFLGESARRRLERAEEDILRNIGCNYGKLYFTSGGTEANNLALHILAEYGKRHDKNHFITSSIEHSSVLNMFRYLETKGYKVTYISPNPDGLISVDDIKKSITDSTIAISLMFVNNELGTIQPINQVGKLCKEKGIYFHCDAVQSIGHIPTYMDENYITFMSASAHKFGGISGVGFLAQSSMFKEKAITPFIFGGRQNKGMRAGTENMVGIMAMSAALEEATNPEHLKRRQNDEEKMFLHLVDLFKTIPDIRINGSLDFKYRIPGNINVSFKNVNSENLIYLLSGDKIYVSASSACEAKNKNKNHVLNSIGVDDDYIGGTIRITFSNYTTMEEITEAFNSIKFWVETLRNKFT